MSKISARRQSARKMGAAEYEKKRTEILRVAASVFKERGLGNATVDEVAKRAGLDRASLYYYFKGKRELFREMVGSATVDNVEMAETIAASKNAPADKLRGLVSALFESYENHYPYLYVYLQEDMNRLTHDNSPWSQKIIDLNRRFDHAVTSIVDEGFEKGDFEARGNAKIIVAGVLGMCNWSHRWFRPDGAMRGPEIAEVFSDMILNGLVADTES